jgi:hypothetical protein
VCQANANCVTSGGRQTWNFWQLGDHFIFLTPVEPAIWRDIMMIGAIRRGSTGFDPD